MCKLLQKPNFVPNMRRTCFCLLPPALKYVSYNITLFQTKDVQFWYFPSRIVLTKCVENFSKCNLKIFYGIKIEKMEAKVLFEVEAVGRDLGMVRGLHFFNRDTIENFQITRGKFFQTLSQTISGGECFFAQLGYILS